MYRIAFTLLLCLFSTWFSNARTVQEDRIRLTVNVYNEQSGELLRVRVELQDDENKIVSRFFSNGVDSAIFIEVPSRNNLYLHIDHPGFKILHLPYQPKEAKKKDCSNVKIGEDWIMLNVGLERPQKGDFLGFDIKFYNNSVVMRPFSKETAQLLLEMMKENPNMKIKIHGHTHSGSVGKFITLENKKREDLRFFYNDQSNETSFGSAKKLSKMRAETVKLYLQSHGIKADRMETEGWGDSDVAYKGDDRDLFGLNMRVQIEVMEQ